MYIKRHKDFLNENDNAERSMKGMAKFGIFPKEEIIARVKKLLSIDPVAVNINDDDFELNIWFMPGSSLKRDIKKDLIDDQLINTHYSLKTIGFENQGNDHVYVLYPKHVEVEAEEEPTIEEIADDLIANSEFREDDLYDVDILMDELDNYLPNSSYDIDVDDHRKIAQAIIDKIGIEEDEED